ncbi:glycosyltransferase [Gemmatimonadota bacterium]
MSFSRFDAIVMLHSVFSNSCLLGGRLFESIAAADSCKAYCIGNEYKLMPEKMRFAEELGIDLLVSQCADPVILELYRQRLGCDVAEIPNTGLDTELFRPEQPRYNRPIDIGYRSVKAALYLGHDERKLIAEYFQDLALREALKVDISLDNAQRFKPAAWAGFLNSCKGQLGTEAGGDFFDLDDRVRLMVNQYKNEKPDVSLQEIKDKFLNRMSKVPCRIISGRNVEAAATKTVQILFEGDYGGYMKPDVHYIALKKDFSNIAEVLEKFRDESYCDRITENAYELALDDFTYDKLIDRLLDHLEPMI